jgi:hypothetical protein
LMICGKTEEEVNRPAIRPQASKISCAPRYY